MKNKRYYTKLFTVDLGVPLRKSGPDHTLLAQRKKHSMWIARDSKFFVANEKEEKEYTTYIYLSKQGSATTFIKGQSACSGVYVGKVRILTDANKISNIQNGEILVTSMTNVSFVPAMKKAGAIVTDLGGITCHAAIVSRELGVPCVIGTGNATELLKDGDIVEVNANHGIIKILEKNS